MFILTYHFIKQGLSVQHFLLYYPIYFIFSTDYKVIASIGYFIVLALVIIAVLNSYSL